MRDKLCQSALLVVVDVENTLPILSCFRLTIAVKNMNEREQVLLEAASSKGTDSNVLHAPAFCALLTEPRKEERLPALRARLRARDQRYYYCAGGSAAGNGGGRGCSAGGGNGTFPALRARPWGTQAPVFGRNNTIRHAA